MNEQIINEVLNDILEELKQSNQSLKTLQTTVGDLQEKTSGFEQKLRGQQQDAKEQLGAISAIVGAQPKNVIKQWRFSIFPDNDINGSFKHLVNKITLGVICLALIAAGYKLGLHYMDSPVFASDHKQEMEIKNKLDTLYKKYMYKKSDGSYQLR